jgi:hypothetical protein
MSVFTVGAKVKVNMPDGWLLGQIMEVHAPYGWTGETKFTIHGIGGNEFVTIASARSLRMV